MDEIDAPLFISGPVTPSVNVCKTPLLATFLGVSCGLIVKGVDAC